MTTILLISAGLVGTLVCGWLAVRTIASRRRRRLLDRLERLTPPLPDAGGDASFDADKTGRLTTALRSIGERIMPATDPGALNGQPALQPRIPEKLVQAGFRHPAAQPLLMCIKASLLVSLAALALGATFWWRGNWVFAAWIAVGAGLCGFLLPDFYVMRRRSRRQATIDRELPDVLDLLIVCTQAGLGLDAAVDRVAEATAGACPVVSTELKTMCLEAQVGRSRQEVLRNFARRTGTESTRSLVAILIQSDRFGTSITQALSTNADALRRRRRLRAEEAAGKAAIKILFPLIFCIFPAIFVVIAGPAVLRLVSTVMPTLLSRL